MDETPTARAPHEVAFGELPELTRALRALGSSRRSAGDLQSLFFRPLLEARRRAADARTARARLRAFDGPELLAGLEKSVAKIVADWPDPRESAKRAIRAQIAERTAALEQELAELTARAANVETAEPEQQLAAWRAWTAQLQRTFECADRSWLAIQSVVAGLTAKRRA
ncbi:MAG TPA: hypothetical protein VFO66_02675 [Gemmatimonadaceae bacterium]|nr:hypothetical protein [Gemmatimonadaceae bacterium]